MENRIKILILNSGSLQFIGDLPKINQGSTNNYLEVYSEIPLDKDYIVETSFRRSDGKTTPYLTLNDIKDENNKIKYYQLRMNSDWYTYVPGDLTLTLKVSRLIVNEESPDQKLVDEYKTANTSVYISPTADFYKPAPVTPTNYEILLDNINSTKHKVDSVISANLVKELETGDTTTLEHTSVKYKTYDGTEREVEIKLPDGLATEEEVDIKINDKFSSVKPITKIEGSNNDLEFIVKQYNSPDKTIKIKTDSLVTEEEYTNRTAELTDDLVAYEKLSDGITPSIQVTFAEQAEKDGLGRVIDETYITNNTNQDIIKRSFQIDRTFAGESTFVNYGANDDGTISLLTKDDEGNTGTVYFKPTTGFIRTIGPVNINNNIQNIPFTNKTNIFEQPQAISQQLDLINENGSRCSIKNVNSNFLISHNGSNLLNIDTGLNKVTFFNKEVVFDEDLVEVESNLNADLNTIANKIVYVECQISGDTYRLTPNSYNSIIISSGDYLHAVTLDVTTSNVTLASSNPINGGSQYTPTIKNIRPIKVGEL